MQMNSYLKSMFHILAYTLLLRPFPSINNKIMKVVEGTHLTELAIMASLHVSSY